MLSVLFILGFSKPGKREIWDTPRGRFHNLLDDIHAERAVPTPSVFVAPDSKLRSASAVTESQTPSSPALESEVAQLMKQVSDLETKVVVLEKAQIASSSYVETEELAKNVHDRRDERIASGHEEVNERIQLLAFMTEGFRNEAGIYKRLEHHKQIGYINGTLWCRLDQQRVLIPDLCADGEFTSCPAENCVADVDCRCLVGEHWHSTGPQLAAEPGDATTLQEQQVYDNFNGELFLMGNITWLTPDLLEVPEEVREYEEEVFLEDVRQQEIRPSVGQCPDGFEATNMFPQVCAAKGGLCCITRPSLLCPLSCAKAACEITEGGTFFQHSSAFICEVRPECPSNCFAECDYHYDIMDETNRHDACLAGCAEMRGEVVTDKDKYCKEFNGPPNDKRCPITGPGFKLLTSQSGSVNKLDGVGWPENFDTVQECQKRCEDHQSCTAFSYYGKQDWMNGGDFRGDCYLVGAASAPHKVVEDETFEADRGNGRDTFRRRDRYVGQCHAENDLQFRERITDQCVTNCGLMAEVELTLRSDLGTEQVEIVAGDETYAYTIAAGEKFEGGTVITFPGPSSGHFTIEFKKHGEDCANGGTLEEHYPGGNHGDVCRPASGNNWFCPIGCTVAPGRARPYCVVTGPLLQPDPQNKCHEHTRRTGNVYIEELKLAGVVLKREARWRWQRRASIKVKSSNKASVEKWLDSCGGDNPNYRCATIGIGGDMMWDDTTYEMTLTPPVQSVFLVDSPPKVGACMAGCNYWLTAQVPPPPPVSRNYCVQDEIPPQSTVPWCKAQCKHAQTACSFVAELIPDDNWNPAPAPVTTPVTAPSDGDRRLATATPERRRIWGWGYVAGKAFKSLAGWLICAPLNHVCENRCNEQIRNSLPAGDRILVCPNGASPAECMDPDSGEYGEMAKVIEVVQPETWVTKTGFASPEITHKVKYEADDREETIKLSFKYQNSEGTIKIKEGDHYFFCPNGDIGGRRRTDEEDEHEILQALPMPE